MKQEMMKGKQRVKGTVLVTVVTVMLVMVLFLMSTLILTTSANRRSYYSYYQTQAQYAAQAAIDAITNNAYSDVGFYNWVESEVSTIGAKGNIYVTFDGSSMGLNARDADGNDLIPANAKLSDKQNAEQSVWCEIERVEPNYIWDEETGVVYEQEAWKVTATAHVGSGRNRTSYSMVNHIYKNVKPPVGQDRKNNVVYKKIDYSQGSNGSSTGTSGSQLSAIFAMGGSNQQSAGHNMSVFGPEYAGMGGIPAGRTNYNNAKNIPTSNDAIVVGNCAYIGNLQINNTKTNVFQNSQEGMVVYGDVSIPNSAFFQVYATPPTGGAGSLDYRQDVNYVYIDGALKTSDHTASIGFPMKSANQLADNVTAANYLPVNLYAGAVQCEQGGTQTTFSINGDMYLYDPAQKSKINGGSDYSHLTQFVYSNINKASNHSPKNFGNLYCNNSELELGGSNAQVKIDGDLIFTNPNGILKIGDKGVHVKGNFICAGSIDEASRAKITCDGIKCVLTINNTTGELELPTGLSDADAATVRKYIDKKADTNGQYVNDLYPSNYAAETPTDTNKLNFSLFPYEFRLDEIFDEYYRWDLGYEKPASESDANYHSDGDTYSGNDNLIKESKAAGHEWKWKEVTYQKSANVTSSGNSTNTFKSDPEEVFTFEQGDYDQNERVTVLGQERDLGWVLSQGRDAVQNLIGNDYKAEWSDGKVDFQDVPGGKKRVTKTTTLYRYKETTITTPNSTYNYTTGTWLVPYTTATKGKDFIEHYVPTVIGTAEDTVLKDTTNFFDSLSYIRTNYPESMKVKTLPKGNATVYFHKQADGTAGTTTLNNAFIVTESCFIDLNSYSGQTLYIDPKNSDKSDTEPLIIVLGSSGDRNSGTKAPQKIVINNTAYDGKFNGSNYTATPYSYDETDILNHPGVDPYAGRQEVILFLQPGMAGFGTTDGYEFSIVMSGSYELFSAPKGGNFDVISNPQYPGYWKEVTDPATGNKTQQWVANATWKNDVPATDKYKYEYMPNTVVCGEAGASYDMGWAPQWNVEVLMPKSNFSGSTTTKKFNGSELKPIIRYREEWNSKIRNGRGNANGNDGQQCYLTIVGSATANNLDVSQNEASIVYLGDTHRKASTTTWIPHNSEDQFANDAPNASDGNDFFNNNYLGAN